MNDRIKELMKEAYEEDRKNECSAWEHSELSDVLLEEFEETFRIYTRLIIQECVTLANNSSQGSESHDEGTVFYYDADIGNKIKQHFGI